MLDKDWYAKTYGGAPRFICQIRSQYEDGKPFTVVSDENWQAFQSPVIADDIYDGETYDARLEGKGQGKPVKKVRIKSMKRTLPIMAFAMPNQQVSPECRQLMPFADARSIPCMA